MVIIYIYIYINKEKVDCQLNVLPGQLGGFALRFWWFRVLFQLMKAPVNQNTS